MIGIVALRSDGTLEYANNVARAMAERRDAFALDAQGIQALRSGDRGRIEAALATLRAGDASTAIGLSLPRSNGRPDYLLQLRRAATANDVERNEAIALEWRILDPQVIAVPDAALLRHLFALTAAQAALAQRLGAGHRHADAAAAQGIQVTTLRAHLTEIYRKTHTTNTAQLVRLLLLIAVSMNSAPELASFVADENIYTADRCEQR